MKKLILSAIMFISVAGIAVAQDTTGMKQHKAGASKGMRDKKSGDWQKGKDSTSHSGKMGAGHTGGKMKRDSTNH